MILIIVIKVVDSMVKHVYYLAMNEKEIALRGLSDKLLQVIYKHGRINDLSVKFDSGVEMTPKEIHFLMTIGENEGINVKELGDHFGVTKSASSQMASRLQRSGYVDKRKSSHNNKEVQLFLTELGQRFFAEYALMRRTQMEDMLSRLDCFTLSEVEAASGLMTVLEAYVSERLAEMTSG